MEDENFEGVIYDGNAIIQVCKHTRQGGKPGSNQFFATDVITNWANFYEIDSLSLFEEGEEQVKTIQKMENSFREKVILFYAKTKIGANLFFAYTPSTLIQIFKHANTIEKYVPGFKKCIVELRSS